MLVELCLEEADKSAHPVRIVEIPTDDRASLPLHLFGALGEASMKDDPVDGLGGFETTTIAQHLNRPAVTAIDPVTLVPHPFAVEK